MNPAGSARSMEVTAFQDASCIGRLKFIYRFQTAIPETIVQSFTGCAVTTFRFSRFVAGGKDLLKINKGGLFQADVVIGGFTAFVYFMSHADKVPGVSPDAFDRHLRDAGYGPVTYREMPKPCFQCPSQHRKECAFV